MEDDEQARNININISFEGKGPASYNCEKEILPKSAATIEDVWELEPSQKSFDGGKGCKEAKIILEVTGKFKDTPDSEKAVIQKCEDISQADVHDCGCVDYSNLTRYSIIAYGGKEEYYEDSMKRRQGAYLYYYNPANKTLYQKGCYIKTTNG